MKYGSGWRTSSLATSGRTSFCGFCRAPLVDKLDSPSRSVAGLGGLSDLGGSPARSPLGGSAMGYLLLARLIGLKGVSGTT